MTTIVVRDRATVEHELAVAVADPRTIDAEPVILALQAELGALETPQEAAELDALADDIAGFLAARWPTQPEPDPLYDWRTALFGDAGVDLTGVA